MACCVNRQQIESSDKTFWSFWCANVWKGKQDIVLTCERLRLRTLASHLCNAGVAKKSCNWSVLFRSMITPTCAESRQIYLQELISLKAFKKMNQKLHYAGNLKQPYGHFFWSMRKHTQICDMYLHWQTFLIGVEDPKFVMSTWLVTLEGCFCCFCRKPKLIMLCLSGNLLVPFQVDVVWYEQISISPLIYVKFY